MIDFVLANALAIPLPDESVQMVATSPPYFGLRDYGTDGQIGLEETPDEYVKKLINVFREVRRVLNPDGVLWLNLGDSYSGGNRGSGGPSAKQDSNRGSRFDTDKSVSRNNSLDSKQLMMIPARVAIALQDDGWWLRSEIVWAKPNPMPESVTDRPTRAHEMIYLLAKQSRYYYDAEAVKEAAKYGRRNWSNVDGNMAGIGINGKRGHATVSGGDPSTGRNLRDVWTITPQSYRGAHFATWPEKLVEPMVKAGSRPGDLVLDPFAGSGTTGRVCARLGRHFVGLDLNPEYFKLAAQRTDKVQMTMEALPVWERGTTGER